MLRVSIAVCVNCADGDIRVHVTVQTVSKHVVGFFHLPAAKMHIL